MATVRTPFTDTTIQRRVISEMIGLLDWTTAPLLKLLWMNGEDKFSFVNMPPGASKKLEWLEDSMSPLADALNGAVTAVQTNFVVDNGSYFHAGHVLEVESEQVIVDSVSTNTLTVIRAQGGTTAATHADNTVVTIRSIAQKTGFNYTIGNTTLMTAPYNYVQTLEESVRVNDDQMSVKDYGVEDTMAYHLAKLIGGGKPVGGGKGKAGQLTILLANMAYYGKRQAPSDSVAGMAGGLSTYITTNLVGDSSTALSRPTIETQLRAIYTAGGSPDLIVATPWAATKINSFYEGFIETVISEERGGANVKKINTPVGQVEVMIDWMSPTTKLHILDTTKVGWVTIDPFGVRKFEPQGYYTVNSVKGEYSFVLQNEKAHAIITHSATL